MLQHEFVAGADFEITHNWQVETRYSRKRLDRTIEDMSITDNLGFYIGNPGSQIADLLHRPTVIPCSPRLLQLPADAANYLNNTPVLRRVPAGRSGHPPLRRRGNPPRQARYRPVVRQSHLHLQPLRGNYPGLTNTEPTDGGTSGRLAPNNSRLFDLPTMTYLPSGKIDDGPLATDRPNTGKAFGFYRLKSKLGDHAARRHPVRLPGHADR